MSCRWKGLVGRPESVRSGQQIRCASQPLRFQRRSSSSCWRAAARSQYSRLRQLIKPALEVLAGVPTIVYGYFALVF